MLKITNYVKAQSLDEAYELCQKKNSVVLGGMLWLKMQNRTVGTAIDLCGLGLDKVEESEDAISIGAMVSLRTLETHPALNQLTQGAMKEALCHIVGVQFRNVATVGGSLYGRFGFSDVLTIFQALDAKVELYKGGLLDMEQFAALPRGHRDILVRVIVPKDPKQVVYLSHRNTATDFPTLTCAVSRGEKGYLCSIGGRPMMAQTFTDENNILAGGVTEESAAAFANDIADRARFDSNIRGSGEYRKKLCRVLVRRALMQLQEV